MQSATTQRHAQSTVDDVTVQHGVFVCLCFAHLEWAGSERSERTGDNNKPPIILTDESATGCQLLQLHQHGRISQSPGPHTDPHRPRLG